MSASTLKALVQKLRPSRFSGMSRVMAAIVGYVLGARFVVQFIAEIAVTSDGVMLARAESEPSAKDFIRNYNDLLRNWLALAALPGSASMNSWRRIACSLLKSGSSGRRARNQRSDRPGDELLFE